MGHEGETDDGRGDGEVVHLEVGVVLADPDGGVGDRFGFGEGGAVGELGPGTALGEAVGDGLGDAVDEGAECGGCDWWGLGFEGGWGGGGGDGLGVGDWEGGRRCGSHCCCWCRVWQI